MQQDLFHITLNEDNESSQQDQTIYTAKRRLGGLYREQRWAGLARGGLCLPCLTAGKSKLRKNTDQHNYCGERVKKGGGDVRVNFIFLF